MRLIGILHHDFDARKIAAFLKQKGIESRCEPCLDSQTGQISYQLWIVDEDKIGEAAADFARFEACSADPEFDLSALTETAPQEAAASEEGTLVGARPRASPVTFFVIALCFMIYFLNGVQEMPMREEGLSEMFLMTPVQAALLYDLPPQVAALEQMIEEHSIEENTRTEDLAPLVQTQIKSLETIPFWRGAFDWFLLKAHGKDARLAEGELFYQVRHGAIWRLFSPAILHTEFLHVLFNMLWLWVLGRPIEQRLGVLKTVFLTLGLGIGSNTAQYLMSGPFFLGYSGIVMGLAGFIWMRQRRAPWEGYPLNRTTVLFLALFVGSMFVLTFLSFFSELFANIAFAPNIANTAHIAGGVLGMLCGRFSFFAWRTR
ncbi:MAG: rhomboid family intramembrane serine protease [Chlamydiia bacterium]|nr:rhomboid family intramembrane serine protease [Chlamydiia bacterium]